PSTPRIHEDDWSEPSNIILDDNWNLITKAITTHDDVTSGVADETLSIMASDEEDFAFPTVTDGVTSKFTTPRSPSPQPSTSTALVSTSQASIQEASLELEYELVIEEIEEEITDEEDTPDTSVIDMDIEENKEINCTLCYEIGHKKMTCPARDLNVRN